MRQVTGDELTMNDDVPKNVWGWIGSGLKALLRLPLGLIETVPPRDLTVTRMGVIEVRIRAYWGCHGRLPGSLQELPLLENRDNATTDGWGQPIQYAVTGSSTVTLTSPGPGGGADGTDPSRAIRVTFEAEKAQEF